MSKKTAFVLMPFLEELNDVYEFLIKEVLENNGYIVRRADDIKSQNNILEDIIRGIYESDLIIADLTDTNPNVYYELGISHALQKNVVLLTQSLNDLPFDLRSYRVIEYSTYFSRMNKVKLEFSEIAREAYKGTLPFGNPVRDFLKVNPTKRTSSDPKQSDLLMESEADKGLLDYRIEMEDSFDELLNIIEEVGDKLTDDLNPEINRSAEFLSSDETSTKQKRNKIQSLAKKVEEYSSFIKPRNEKYRALNINLETSFERLLGDEVDYTGVESQKELVEFVNNIKSMEIGAYKGRQGFSSLLSSLKSLPKMEKNFNRASKYMQKEVENFIGNIDHMIAVLSRANNLAKALISHTSDS